MYIMEKRAEEYRTVTDTAQGQIIEKKSKFIATIYHVETEQEAISVIEAAKKQYWDARHNCYAYVLGENSQIMRFSDDGEPSGTAGKPILEILKTRGLTDTLVVVTRYFGGVLLGTGGLIRAYGDATLKAIDNAGEAGSLVRMCLMRELIIRTDYTLSGKVQYVLSESEAIVSDTVYDEAVSFKIAAFLHDEDAIKHKITDVTNGKAEIASGEVKYIAVRDR